LFIFDDSRCGDLPNAEAVITLFRGKENSAATVRRAPSTDLFRPNSPSREVGDHREDPLKLQLLL
jgi:hypothetical protein